MGELLWVKMWVNVVDCNEARLSTLPRTLIHIGESSVEAQLEVAFSKMCIATYMYAVNVLLFLICSATYMYAMDVLL